MGSSNNPGTGTYRLRLTNVPAPHRFPVTLPARIEAGVPGEGAGLIEAPGAEDVYSFDLPAEGLLSLKVASYDAGITYLSMRLLNAKDEEIAERVSRLRTAETAERICLRDHIASSLATRKTRARASMCSRSRRANDAASTAPDRPSSRTRPSSAPSRRQADRRDGDEVGALAGLDRADLACQAEQVGGVHGRGLDRLGGVMPCFTISSNSSALRPCIDTPASVPNAIFTPRGYASCSALPVIPMRHSIFARTSRRIGVRDRARGARGSRSRSTASARSTRRSCRNSLMLSSSSSVPCSIESAPAAQRERDAVGAVRVHGDLLAVEVRGLDDGARLVLEHLRAEPGADAAVHAAGRHDLDDVDAARDLQAHGAPADSTPSQRLSLVAARSASPRDSRASRPCGRRSRRSTLPASRMRGPGILPAATASRRASVTPSPSPRLRTVVNPAVRVLRAFTAAS